MRIINPSVKIIRLDGNNELRFIEIAARNCYKSEDKITDTSNLKMAENLCSPKGGGVPHTAMLEFGIACFRIVCDRGVSHELVRHRLASYAQESTRFCNYGKGKFGNELTFIKPCFFEDVSTSMSYWMEAMGSAEEYYMHLLDCGCSAQEARSVLPNSLKTEIVMQANFTEWRHIFKLRLAPNAHPQMRQVMRMVADAMIKNVPIIFDEWKDA